MLTLVVVTASLLGVILVTAVVTVLVFAMQTLAFMAETSAGLEVVEQRATRLVGRLERLQGATEAAASQLAAPRA